MCFLKCEIRFIKKVLVFILVKWNVINFLLLFEGLVGNIWWSDKIVGGYRFWDSWWFV